MARKIDYKKLEKNLTLQKTSCWDVWNSSLKNKAFAFAEDYKKFINEAKTAREAVKVGEKLARKCKFKNLNEIKSLAAGDKIYFVQRDKSIVFAKIGKKSITEGFNMIMSHIDSPHLDLKVKPLYEDENLAYFKTHYYGGIKKYQWPTIALALHGVVYLENGKEIDITIGEKENDPIFMITDLLPHLDRPSGPGAEIKFREVLAEDLNLLIGSVPVGDKDVKEKIKIAILENLNKEYGIKEEDLSSADLQIVPSEKARDLGFDRSLISAYGQDDKICSFASIHGLLDSKISEKTQICAWVDREEIGSDGNTGAQSVFFETFVSDLLKLETGLSSLDNVYRIFANSQALSANTVAAYDPDYKEVYDARNDVRLGHGVTIEKYTGARGKAFSSEASSKFIRDLRVLFKKNKNIIYQISGGMGKVDQGGGGTIAKYMANRNIEIIDAGVALFNIHAPLEIASKADLYCAYLAYKTFLE